MNAILLMFVVLAGLLAIAAWLSPDLLENMSIHFYARASALRASRSIYRATYSACTEKTARRNILNRAASAAAVSVSLLVIVACISALVVMPQ